MKVDMTLNKVTNQPTNQLYLLNIFIHNAFLILYVTLKSMLTRVSRKKLKDSEAVFSNVFFFFPNKKYFFVEFCSLFKSWLKSSYDVISAVDNFFDQWDQSIAKRLICHKTQTTKPKHCNTNWRSVWTAKGTMLRSSTI